MAGHHDAARYKEAFVLTPGHGRMHWFEAGSGTPFILIHTNGGSAYQYAGCFEHLGQAHRCIAWEMPGHGDADPLPRHYSIEDYCDALASFLDVMNIPAAHVAGTSCGGTIVACFANRFASRTLSASIVETPLRTSDEWAARWDHTEGNFGLPTQTKEEVGRRLNHVDDAVVARWNIDRNKAGAKLMMSVMWAMRNFDVQGAVASVQRPAMMVFGAKGPTISLRDRLQTLNPGMAVAVLEDSGHFPMIDEPQRFSQVLAGFAQANGG
jgi:pimeloyl-ACP methyl ester carboxylesterase